MNIKEIEQARKELHEKVNELVRSFNLSTEVQLKELKTTVFFTGKTGKNIHTKTTIQNPFDKQ